MAHDFTPEETRIIQQEWQEIVTWHGGNEVEYDQRRAALLQRYVAEGKDQKAIARALKLSQPHIANLLRYHRFCIAMAIQEKIVERRFREYWRQVSDPRMVQGRKPAEQKAAYEKVVFESITVMLNEGKPPMKPVKPVKRKTPAQIAKSVNWQKAVDKEVKEIFKAELRPAMERLQGLLHADRATYSPSGQANAAYALERAVTQILQILTDLKDDDMIHLTDEPEWHETGSGARVPVLPKHHD